MFSLTSMRALAPGPCAPRARGAKPRARIAAPSRVRVSAAGDVADFADARVRAMRCDGDARAIGWREISSL